MIVHDQDPDVVRWGLHTLIDICKFPRSGSCNSVTRYDSNNCQVGYVVEGYSEEGGANDIENDAMIASALQEELSRIYAVESAGVHNPVQESILAQNWLGAPGRCNDSELVTDGRNKRKVDECTYNEPESSGKCSSEENDEVLISFSSPNAGEESFCSNGEESVRVQDLSHLLEIADESTLDGELGKRLNQMVPIPHVPKINGELPSEDEVVSDHQRLLDRLKLYDLVENKVQGDGNCQFRALSDQLYRSAEHHKAVRERVLFQLKTWPQKYEGYVPMGYADYLKKMSKSGEWGDHVTLQAAADSYGVKIFVLTSFRDTCYIEILPEKLKSERVIFLSFWAEVHYNSIYPEGELPPETKKKKKWWMLGV